MRKLTAIFAAVLLASPIAAKAEPTFLVCEGKTELGPFTWQITLNEAASTVSLARNGRSFTALAGFGPESVNWTHISGSVQVAFHLNRLTGEINNRMIVPSSWGKKHQESAKKRTGSGQCYLQQAPKERKF